VRWGCPARGKDLRGGCGTGAKRQDAKEVSSSEGFHFALQTKPIRPYCTQIVYAGKWMATKIQSEMENTLKKEFSEKGTAK
jgi:hypothetical protein